MNYVMLVVFGISMLSLRSCSPSPTPALHEVRDGVEYVYNSGAGLWRGSRKLEFRRLATIGNVERDSNDVLADPRDIAVDEEGRIYINDFKDNCVKVFDSTGQFVRRIGRKGEGPGELIGPSFVDIDARGRLYVVSVRPNRLSVYTTGGQFLHSFRLSTLFPVGMVVQPLTGAIFFAASPPLHFEGQVRHNDIIFKFSSVGDELASFCERPILGQTSRGYQYSAGLVSLLAEGSVICALSYPYRVEVYSSDGALRRVITKKSKMFSEPRLVEVAPGLEMLIPRTEIHRVVALPDGRFLLEVRDKGPLFAKLIERRSRQSISPGFGISYDLFDGNGCFLQSFPSRFDSLGVIVYVDSRGNAYTLSAPDRPPVVQKYAISFVNE